MIVGGRKQVQKMTDNLFPIEDYKQVSQPEIAPLKCPYFCVGFYIGRGNWKIFSEMFDGNNTPDINKFIEAKESTGWILFMCKLPDFKMETKNGKT